MVLCYSYIISYVTRLCYIMLSCVISCCIGPQEVAAQGVSSLTPRSQLLVGQSAKPCKSHQPGTAGLVPEQGQEWRLPLQELLR